MRATAIRTAAISISAGAVVLAALFPAVLFAGTAFAAAAEKSSPVGELRPLEVGVTLPVRIPRYLQAGKVKTGTSFVAETTQRVPVGEYSFLNRGTKLQGEVVASVKGDGTSAKPSVLGIHFTTLEYRGQTVPISTKAVAIANFVQVDDTRFPATGSTDRGNSNPASWTTLQVGGDVVARSGWVGDVCDSTLQKVGFADFYGVYSLPAKPPDGVGPPFPRALGVFSTTASGLYGIEEGTTMHSAGGTTTLTRVGRKLLLRNGDQMLLEVVVGAGGKGSAE